MKILAIETATEACSAALLVDDKEVISRFELAPREHTKKILPMMEAVLKEGGVEKKDLDVIAFSRGPGAFTGLRIAAGIAQGVALSIDKPVAPVSTLEALALAAVRTHQVTEGTKVIASLDARMGEVYWGVFIYQDNAIEALSEEQVTKPEEMMAEVNKLLSMKQDKTFYVLGSGWDAYQEKLFKDGKAEIIVYIKSAYPSAQYIAELAIQMVIGGKTVSAEEAQPVYIRNKVADKPNKKSE